MAMKVHGGDIYSYMQEKGVRPLDFSANINPLGLPKGVKTVLKNSVEQFKSYPDIDCTVLKTAIGRYECVLPETIELGNGAADLIFRLVYDLQPKRALLLAPTFSEYAAALENVGCEIRYFPLTAEKSFLVDEALLDAVIDVDIFFFCNPNNPTGIVTNAELLGKLANRCKQIGCIFVVDECFMDFLMDSSSYSCKKWLQTYNNLIIIKAFTKFFAMAGLRLGYCLCENRPLLDQIVAAGQPWSVSTPANLAGIEALKDTPYMIKTRLLIQKERNFLTKGLRKLGMTVFDSCTNFILFQLPTPALDLHAILYEKGIFIRSCHNFQGLEEGFYRIAVKNRTDNKILLQALTVLASQQ